MPREDAAFKEFVGSNMLLVRATAWWMVCDTEWLDWCVEKDACTKWEYELEGGVFDVCPKADKWEGLALGGKGLWLRPKGVDTFSSWDIEWAGTGDILTCEFEPRWLGEVGLHWLDIGGDVLAIKWLREVVDWDEGLDFQGPWIWNRLHVACFMKCYVHYRKSKDMKIVKKYRNVKASFSTKSLKRKLLFI